MQTNSNLFALSQANMRQLNWSLGISWDKTYNASTTFFKVGNSGSRIGGSDLIPGSNSVVQEWDKYQYVDYSDRVISIQLTREVEQVSSVTMCYGDLVLNNYDDLFTPGAGGPLDAYLLPYRPLRIWQGFGTELVPVFVGLTDGTPVIDEDAKTASFHIIDFLYSLKDKPMNVMPIDENCRTDEALTTAFTTAGLLSSQLVLDRGYNTVDAFYTEKDDTLLNVLKQLMEAEQGRLYMDEQGVIRFKNRQNYSSQPVMTFDAYNNIIQVTRTREDSIVNVVEVKSNLRDLQATQKIFESSTSLLVNSNSTAELWVQFEDPVSAIDVPVYIASATTSSFAVNTAEDGSGTADATSVTITSDDLYSTSYRITFTNSSSNNLYVTSVIIYGQAYSVTDSLFIREQDNTSVDKYEERLLQLDNNYFQDQSTAESKALTILDDYSQFAAVQQMEVKGTPQLQLEDVVRIDVFGRIQTAKIVRIESSMEDGVYNQTLRFKTFNPRTYFQVGDGGSQVGATAYIGF